MAIWILHSEVTLEIQRSETAARSANESRMNYVGHAFHGPNEPLALVGNVLGDFFKGPLPGELEPGLAAGVAVHRQLNRFCDTHAAFRASRQRFFDGFSHYAGVLVDVCFDHVLSTRWTHYTNESFDDFVERTYDAIKAHRTALPSAQRERADRFISVDTLRRYVERADLAEALRRLSTRLRRPVDLVGGIEVFVECQLEFEQDYDRLHADLAKLRHDQTR